MLALSELQGGPRHRVYITPCIIDIKLSYKYGCLISLPSYVPEICVAPIICLTEVYWLRLVDLLIKLETKMAYVPTVMNKLYHLEDLLE